MPDSAPSKTAPHLDVPAAPRLWPGLALVVILIVVRFGLPLLSPDLAAVGAMGSLVISGLVLLWWLFFSRLPWADRLIGLGVGVVALFAARPLLHESMALAGYGMLYWIFALPTVCLALVLWTGTSARLATAPRRAILGGLLVLAAGFWTAIRFDGADGSIQTELSLRWSPTAEDQLVATGDQKASGPGSVQPIDTGGGWIGFRGPERDSRIPGLRIATDWDSSPPEEIWRRPVGPGWSSFSIRGDLLFTQEQRGEEEVVAAYRVSNGEPVWKHADPVRFWEAIGGAGPRGTPTVHREHLLAIGATGILNLLDAETGDLVWSRDTVADTGATIPDWGISGSPLVVDDVIYVGVSDTLAAYPLDGGAPLWKGPTAGEGYSSAHLWRTDAGEQIVFFGSDAVRGFDPADGSELWEHEWAGAPIVQPAFTPDGDLLLAVSQSSGLRRLRVAQQADGSWSQEEIWTSNRLKPYFNDFVVHGDHAYGFDNAILACIDLAEGKRAWKGGRYGNGQLVLLVDQDLLLVLSEDGELVLVSATPDGFEEITKMEVIDGKTWNHPVVAGDVLLVRNGQEMVALRLPRA